jgi:hypothetical protein
VQSESTRFDPAPATGETSAWVGRLILLLITWQTWYQLGFSPKHSVHYRQALDVPMRTLTTKMAFRKIFVMYISGKSFNATSDAYLLDGLLTTGA